MGNKGAEGHMLMVRDSRSEMPFWSRENLAAHLTRSSGLERGIGGIHFPAETMAGVLLFENWIEWASLVGSLDSSAVAQDVISLFPHRVSREVHTTEHPPAPARVYV